MVEVDVALRADGKHVVWTPAGGGGHLLCTGTSGAGKSSLLSSMLYSALADNGGRDGEDDAQHVVLNPKLVGFELFERDPRVKVYNDVSVAESVLSAMWWEVQRRYAMMVTDESTGAKVLPSDVRTLLLWVDELPSLVSDGALLMPASVKSVKTDMLRVLRLGRQARVFVLSYTQFAEASAVGGSSMRSLYDSRCCMRVSSASEASMATGMSESEFGVGDNCTMFLPGEMIVRVAKGTSFVRAWSHYRTEAELARLVGELPRTDEPDWEFLEKRGL